MKRCGGGVPVVEVAHEDDGRIGRRAEGELDRAHARSHSGRRHGPATYQQPGRERRGDAGRQRRGNGRPPPPARPGAEPVEHHPLDLRREGDRLPQPGGQALDEGIAAARRSDRQDASVSLSRSRSRSQARLTRILSADSPAPVSAAISS